MLVPQASPPASSGGVSPPEHHAARTPRGLAGGPPALLPARNLDFPGAVPEGFHHAMHTTGTLMKLTHLLLALLAGGVVSASAQQSDLAATATNPEATRQNPPSKLSGTAIKKETYAGGVFARTYKDGRQLRLVNPLYLNPTAPLSLGNGADNLVYNPFTGLAEGVAIISYRF